MTNDKGQTSNLWWEAWQRFRRDRMAILGLVILLVIFIAVAFGPTLYKISIDRIDFGQSTAPPSWEHPLALTISVKINSLEYYLGGRVSLTVAIAAMLVATFLGTFIGAIAGFYGGVVDGLLMRLTDLFLSLPQLPLLLLIVYLFRDTIRAIAGPEVGILL